VKIGFIGVGHMGRHMASHLIRAGHQLTISDTRAEARSDSVLEGAEFADTPREVAERSQLVITSLPGPEQVNQVVLGPDGVLEGMHPGDVYIDMSTSTPDSIRAIATAAAPGGVEVLDAPVAGGIRGARHATLTIMVGGSSDAFAASEPVLRTMGEHIFRVGDVGCGHVAKLVNNMMTIVNGLTAMEAMVVGARAGVDIEKLLEVAEAGTGGSYALNVFRYVIFKGNFEPAKFALSLAAKDLRLSVEYAEELGVPLAIVQRASEAMAAAVQHGLGDKDWSSYVTLLEDAAGVQLRV